MAALIVLLGLLPSMPCSVEEAEKLLSSLLPIDTTELPFDSLVANLSFAVLAWVTIFTFVWGYYAAESPLVRRYI